MRRISSLSRIGLSLLLFLLAVPGCNKTRMAGNSSETKQTSAATQEVARKTIEKGGAGEKQVATSQTGKDNEGLAKSKKGSIVTDSVLLKDSQNASGTANVSEPQLYPNPLDYEAIASNPARSGRSWTVGAQGSSSMPVKITIQVSDFTDLIISVFDLGGGLIKKIGPVRNLAPRMEKRFVAGHYEVAWDGRNEEGRPMARGAYVMKIVATLNANSQSPGKTTKSVLRFAVK